MMLITRPENDDDKNACAFPTQKPIAMAYTSLQNHITTASQGDELN